MIPVAIAHVAIIVRLADVSPFIVVNLAEFSWPFAPKPFISCLQSEIAYKL